MEAQLNTEISENIGEFLNSLIEDVEKALILIASDGIQASAN